MRNVLCSVPRLSDEMSEKLGEVFLKHEKAIEVAVRYHQYKYGGDYESLYARAVDKLILAFHHYDPLRSEWEKYIAVQIRYGLLDETLYHVRKKTKISTNIEEVFLEIPVISCDSYDIEELKESLTADAEYILNYITECSDVRDMRKCVRTVRSRTRAMGWSCRRTETAFTELRCMIESEI